MKIAHAAKSNRSSRRGFTLVELMVAMVASMALTGTVFMLLVETAYEQRNGLADTAVEEHAYLLQGNLTKCLRGMSANQGITPDNSTRLVDAGGNTIGYTGVFVFTPTNGGYVTANINYNANTGSVIYTPDISVPWAQDVWMSSVSSAALTQFYFNTSLNIDGSQNNSLVNITFAMNDNGFSQQGSVNNPSSIYRNFAVQLRNDY